jgi:transcriptional regulator with XRE-family HTH domain
MDDLRFGRVIRAVRLRLGLSQERLGVRAGVSQATVSRIERGHLDGLQLGVIRSVARALEVQSELTGRWRGGELDRLVGARHSALHDAVARSLAMRPGWRFLPEVSFAIWGERGIVDILAFHRQRRALLVIELKTAIVDVNELLGTLDRKVRLAPAIAAERGWAVPRDVTVSAWVIVAEARTNRRRVQGHAAMLRAALPDDGRSVAGWLSRPRRALRCLSFWSLDASGASR